MNDPLTLRDRRRAETTAEIAAAALDLAVERGWDQVTVDDVAARAGISRRTFFNYFSTKDEALFHDAMAWRPGALEAFTASPAPLLDALEELFAAQAARDTPDRDRALRVMRLVDGSPELLPGLLARIAASEQALAAAVAARSEVDEFTARTVAAVAGALARVSGTSWIDGRQPDPLSSTRAAWAALRTLVTTDRRTL